MHCEKEYKVRSIHASHQSSLEEIYEKLVEITKPLSRSWEKIEKTNIQF